MSRPQRVVLAWFVLPAFAACANADPESQEFFERSVHPILATHCTPCHGAEKQWSGLRLDSRAAVLRGGDSGPAVVPGEPEHSALLTAVRRTGDLPMPPDDPLHPEQVAVLEEWIARGAPWSAELESPAVADAAAPHWAFQPVARPTPPESPISGALGPRHPIDCFLDQRLASAGLATAPRASRRELIRRVTVDLTGLLPTAEEAAAFEQSEDPAAYERLVDRLLASPAYGERWARHWLDLARYSDSKGYVYAREGRFWVHAWLYRDWVVKSLNEDLPYDRFLLLQIAADQAAPDDPDAWAAMGFLTLGRRFLGVMHDIYDDRIDVVTRTATGMTASCARCHDHKYDPISTAEYYALYGVFQNSMEQRTPLPNGDVPGMTEAHREELRKLQQEFQSKWQHERSRSMARARLRVADYLHAQFALSEYPDEAFSQILGETELLPAFVRRWRIYLEKAAAAGDPVFAAWHAFARLPATEFAVRAAEVVRQLHELPPGSVHPRVLELFSASSSPSSMQEVVDRYGRLLQEIDRQWSAAAEAAAAAQPGSGSPGEGPADPDMRALWEVLFGPNSPCTIPTESLAHTEFLFPTRTTEELWRLEGQIDEYLLSAQFDYPMALRLTDRPEPYPARVFRRGNSALLGDFAPQRLPEFLTGFAPSEPFAGSGRLALAQALIDPRNPLTARVMANRLWQAHFGAGLVRTPSDFGRRAEPPSHPELLDYLATYLIDHGWSLKALHRLMVLSEAYQRNSRGPDDPAALAAAVQADPENRLRWRMTARRFSFEELRDNALRASGELDQRIGGKPGELFDDAFRRRTLYGRIDRQFVPATLRIFDFANPDMHAPLRNETVVPQQALFFLNHPWMHLRAERLAVATQDATDPSARVRSMFLRTLQREPTDAQLQEALTFIAEAASQPTATAVSPPVEAAPVAATEPAADASAEPAPPRPLNAWEELALVLLSSNEFLFVD